jgi:hypothetical protein
MTIAKAKKQRGTESFSAGPIMFTRQLLLLIILVLQAH